MTSPAGEPSPETPKANPYSIIESTSAARTLTVSDQHATILLTSSNSTEDQSSEDKRALLKLTLVPFHKTSLACISNGDAKDAKESAGDDKETEEGAKCSEEKEHSSRVLAFLSRFDWRMTSESGAEYSYYEAFLKPDHEGPESNEEPEHDLKRIKLGSETDVDDKTSPLTNASKWSSFKVEFISPASDRQVARAMPSPGLTMIEESPALYEFVTKPFIDGIVSSGSLAWIQNVVTGKKEKERLLHDADNWILNVDTKWRTHPDALTVPRIEWFKHESIIDLYCLGITKWKGVSSLRDLTGEHVPVLKDMLQEGTKVIESMYGVKKDQLRVFVHYQPQFYHFHVHFTRLENDTGAQAEKAHLLADVIQNLEMDTDYYKKRTMTYKLSFKDKLYKLISAHVKEERAEEK